MNVIFNWFFSTQNEQLRCSQIVKVLGSRFKLVFMVVI